MSDRSPPEPLTRRNFVRIVATGGGAVALGGTLANCTGDVVAPRDHPALSPNFARGGPGGGATTRTALRIPAKASPTGNFALTAAPGGVEIVPGKTTQAWLYNGQFPGPTLEAQKGSQATVRFTNGLPQQSITHWHGMVVDHENDGHPMMAVAPGGTYQQGYAFTINQRAALNWYHTHPHLVTAEQVYRA